MTVEHHIYTDGSCPVAYGPGAWAFIVLGAEANVYDAGHLPAPQTNNTMELMAVLMALRYVKEMKLRDQSITIHADSTYVINGMISQFRHQVADGSIDPPNADIWKRLHKHAEACKSLKFVHVKGHSGDTWNTYADRMAWKALQDGTRAHTMRMRERL